MKAALPILLAGVALVPTGCMTLSADIAQVDTKRSAIAHEQPIATVRLDESFWLESEATYKMPGILPGIGEPQVSYSTGKLWRTMFIGPHDAPGVLMLKSQEFHRHTNPVFYLVPGPSWITYKVTCDLEVGGETHILHAEGKCGAYIRFPEGTRIAVDVAIADIVKQVRQIMDYGSVIETGGPVARLKN